MGVISVTVCVYNFNLAKNAIFGGNHQAFVLCLYLIILEMVTASHPVFQRRFSGSNLPYITGSDKKMLTLL